MSIEARLRDARFLYDNGRFEGALLMVLVAAAGTSKLRRPKAFDKEAFVKFVEEEGLGGCPVTVDGNEHSAADFFYKFLRNNLIHEATLHSQVVFQPAVAINEASIKWLCVTFPGKTVIEHPMVLVIGSKVASAKENASLPDDLKGPY